MKLLPFPEDLVNLEDKVLQYLLKSDDTDGLTIQILLITSQVVSIQLNLKTSIMKAKAL